MCVCVSRRASHDNVLITLSGVGSRFIYSIACCRYATSLADSTPNCHFVFATDAMIQNAKRRSHLIHPPHPLLLLSLSDFTTLLVRRVYTVSYETQRLSFRASLFSPASRHLTRARAIRRVVCLTEHSSESNTVT